MYNSGNFVKNPKNTGIPVKLLITNNWVNFW